MINQDITPKGKGESTVPKVVTYAGIVYQDKSALCERLQIDLIRLNADLKKGFSLEDAVKRRLEFQTKRDSEIVAGMPYKTYCEYCKSRGISGPRLKSIPSMMKHQNLTLSQACEIIQNEIENGIEYNGNIYWSYTSLGKALKLKCTASFTNKIAVVGMAAAIQWAEDFVEENRTTEFVHKSVTYSSLQDAANRLNFSYSTATSYKRLNPNKSLSDITDYALKRNLETCIEYEGKKYSSLKKWSKAFGLSYTLVKTRRRSGWSLDKIRNTPIQEHQNYTGTVINGVTYNSLAQIARDLGITTKTVREKLQAGESFEKPMVTVLGNEYVSLAEACASLGAEYWFVLYLKNKRNFSVDDAVRETLRLGRTAIKDLSYQYMADMSILGVTIVDIAQAHNTLVKHFRYHSFNLEEYILETLLWKVEAFLGFTKDNSVVMLHNGEVILKTFPQYIKFLAKHPEMLTEMADVI